ncbi:MAG: hypothetical protein AAF747_02470 [Planctomycetota bacterium]
MAGDGDNANKSVMRCLGEFVGEVWRGVKTPAKASTTHRVRESVEEEQRETDAGPVIVRRTTIEEIEMPRRSSPADQQGNKP